MKVSIFRSIVFLMILCLNHATFAQREEGNGKSTTNSEITTEPKAQGAHVINDVVEEGASLVYRPRGTGRTTGHILTLSVTNTGSNTLVLMDTGKPGLDALAIVDEQKGTASSVFGEKGKYENGLIDLDCAMAYIPAGKKYQDYVATGVQWPPGITQSSSKADQFGQTAVVSIDPDETVVIPVTGYCANIRQPPVPLGEQITAVNDWISATEAEFPGAGQLDELGIIVQEAPPGGGPYLANIPPETGLSKDQTLIMSINPQLTPYIETWAFNRAFAAFLFNALDRIRITAIVLQKDGAIRTPFSSEEKRATELETLIQQTFWIYSSVLRGDNYTKNEFSEKMMEQFENNTGQKLENVPPETADKLEGGVNDFWGSFELVGASAKVLKSDKDSNLEGSLPPGTQEKLEEEFQSSDFSGVKTHTDEAGKEAAKGMGASGHSEDDGIAYPEGTARDAGTEEVAHSTPTKGDPIANSADLGSIDEKKDFDNWRRKKFDEYAIEREINEKSHHKACEAIGIDAKSELGKALKRVYQNEKSK